MSTHPWNEAPEPALPTERPCPVCKGRYPDVDLCITCEGNGTVEMAHTETRKAHEAQDTLHHPHLHLEEEAPHP